MIAIGICLLGFVLGPKSVDLESHGVHVRVTAKAEGEDIVLRSEVRRGKGTRHRDLVVTDAVPPLVDLRLVELQGSIIVYMKTKAPAYMRGFAWVIEPKSGRFIEAVQPLVSPNFDRIKEGIVSETKAGHAVRHPDRTNADDFVTLYYRFSPKKKRFEIHR